MEAFLRLKLVSIKQTGTDTSRLFFRSLNLFSLEKLPQTTRKLGILSSLLWLTFTYIVIFLDHALTGHDMEKAVVVDEYECQLKCIGNDSCKSLNVYSNGTKRICELNNKTRQMKPDDFKWMKGLTYYGYVQAS